MSWPSDGKPRYVVGCCHGDRVPRVGSVSTPQQASFPVLDRAHCHARVAEYGSEDRLAGKVGGPTLGVAVAQERAVAHAQRLNAA